MSYNRDKREDRDFTEQEEMLIDKLKGGDFDEVCDKATKTMEKQKEFMCLINDKKQFSMEDNLDRITRIAGQRAEEEAFTIELGKSSKKVVNTDERQFNSSLRTDLLETEEDSDLLALRRNRMEQMRREKLMHEEWRKKNHGKLNLLADEKQFFTDVKQHERSILVIHPNTPQYAIDGTAGTNRISASDKCRFMEFLPPLANKHLETMFFHLHAEKARTLMMFLDLGGEGLPVLYILRHGEVICRISQSLLEDPEMTSAKLEKLLIARDAFGFGARWGGDDSDRSDGERSD